MDTKHRDLTNLIIKAFYNVYNLLGYGFAEKVYHNALMIELQRLGPTAEKEHHIKVYFRSKVVGEFFADIVVNDLVILELKAVQTLIEQHEAQLLSYLRATKYEVGLLLNFCPKPEIQRKSYNNSAQGNMSWLSPT